MKRKDNNTEAFIDRLNKKKNGSLKNEREQGSEIETNGKTVGNGGVKDGSLGVAGASTAVNGLGLDEEALAMAMKMMKKKSRVYQRSIKLDERINRWLDNVKRYLKEDLGIARPCLDDLMYEAIVEYLERHYEELEP